MSKVFLSRLHVRVHLFHYEHLCRVHHHILSMSIKRITKPVVQGLHEVHIVDLFTLLVSPECSHFLTELLWKNLGGFAKLLAIRYTAYLFQTVPNTTNKQPRLN